MCHVMGHPCELVSSLHVLTSHLSRATGEEATGQDTSGYPWNRWQFTLPVLLWPLISLCLSSFLKTGTTTFISLNMFYQIRSRNLCYIVKRGLFWKKALYRNNKVLSTGLTTYLKTYIDDSISSSLYWHKYFIAHCGLSWIAGFASTVSKQRQLKRRRQAFWNRRVLNVI